MRIAIVEDDTHVGQLMCLWLDGAGHHYQLFTNGADFQKALTRESYDLVILDWMLPDTTGDKLLVLARERGGARLPVIFATSRDTEEDVVRGLTLGADDYITKPVRHQEFLARIGAVMRRAQPPSETNGRIEAGSYVIDMASRRIQCGEQVFDLTQKEYDLAVFLFRHEGQLLSRGHILQSVWGHQSDLTTRTVDTHASRLRVKLGLGPQTGWTLVSVYNHGYRLERADGRQRAG